jgi:large subunit ribosomal protein L13
MKPGWDRETLLTKARFLVLSNFRPSGEQGDVVDFDSQAKYSMKCYQARAGELAKQWFVIDAAGMVVGRLAAQIAPILMGKHRPTYTPHIDTGDYVIVTNVDKVVFTGDKWNQKSYQRYTGYPGGQREEAAWKLFERRPERILELAIQRMMPKNKIGRHMLAKLKLYVGPEHPHQAQQPVTLEPLSGRPAPAGALVVPPPAPKEKGMRVKAEPKAKGEAPAPSAIAAASSVEPALEAPPHEESLPAPPAEESLPAPPAGGDEPGASPGAGES